MVTLGSYLALQHYVGNDWVGWLLVLPALFDLAIISRIFK